MGGVSAAVSKTAAAPIERVKLLIQNQVRAIWLLSAGLMFGHSILKSEANVSTPHRMR